MFRPPIVAGLIPPCAATVLMLFWTPGAATGEEVQGYLSPPASAVEVEPAPPPLRLAEAARLTALVELPTAETGASDSLALMTSWNSSGNAPLQDGFVRSLPTRISVVNPRLAPEERSASAGASESATAPDGRWIWGTSVHVRDSYRLRLQLTDVQFPPGTQIWVWGEAEEPRVFGLELVGPDGTLWTPSVAGPTIYLEIAFPREFESEITGPFATLSGVAQSFVLTADGAPILEPYPEAPNLVTSCLLNAGCYSNSGIPGIDSWKRGVAHLKYIKAGQSYMCSGNLLNNSKSDGTPYFLTANHCFSTQSEASTLEAYWDYITPCGGSTPSLGSLPRSNGATLLATSANSDFTFLRLNSLPSNRYFFGWNQSTGGAPAGTFLYRLHHPLGASMSLSGAPVSGSSCPGGPPPSTHLYLDPQPELGNGATFGGSSGSASLLASGQVVGQLRGGCGPFAAEPCLAATGDFDDDGRFSTTYPSISQYLSPSGGGTGPCVASATTACFQNGRFEAKVTWTTVSGSGPANVMYFGGQRATTQETAFFQFFSPTNFEMGLKVLNACIELFGYKYWVFISGLTDQGWSVQVRDTVTGQVRTYTNNLGTLSTTFRDQNSFSCN